jgi:hypothetical protein
MSAFATIVRLVTAGAIIASLGSGAVARDESGAREFTLGQKASTANFFRSSLNDVTGSVEPMKPRKVKRSRPAVAMAPAVVKPAAIAPVLTGWEQAILNDESLRRGDIVMFASGPKVFNGAARKGPWTVADFEDLATTKAVANRSREALLASIGKPADETVKPLSPTETAATSAPLVVVATMAQ